MVSTDVIFFFDVGITGIGGTFRATVSYAHDKYADCEYAFWRNEATVLWQEND